MTHASLGSLNSAGDVAMEVNSVNYVSPLVLKGWPGKNKTILLTYTFDEIDKVEVFIREGLNPKRIIYLLNKDGRKIPLNPISQLMSLQEIEDRPFKLVNFLKVNLVLNIKRNS
jgi:hypothetical protein